MILSVLVVVMPLVAFVAGFLMAASGVSGLEEKAFWRGFREGRASNPTWTETRGAN